MPAFITRKAIKMKHQTLAMAVDQEAGFAQHRKPTRRDTFLQTMQAIVPWPALCEVIEPHYPKAGNGRPPIGLERMLRIHFLHHWFNLADLSCEEALYDSASLRLFVGIDLGRQELMAQVRPQGPKVGHKAHTPSPRGLENGQLCLIRGNLTIRTPEVRFN